MHHVLIRLKHYATNSPSILSVSTELLSKARLTRSGDFTQITGCGGKVSEIGFNVNYGHSLVSERPTNRELARLSTIGLFEGLDAANAAFEIGCARTSQFNR